jgi:hypothetical protein
MSSAPSSQYNINVPITVNGNANEKTVEDIKRVIEDLIPSIMKQYDIASIGI